MDKQYFETCAAGHICCKISIMQDAKLYDGAVHSFGGKAKVQCIGSVDLAAVFPDGTTKIITLRRVLYVPSLGVDR